MHPIIFTFGAVHIYSYGFMLALAFLTGIITTIHFAKKEGYAAETILDLAVYVIIAAIVGARLFYVLGQWENYRNQPLEIVMLQNGGMVFLGGLLLSFAAVIVYAKIKKLSLLKLLDCIAPGTTLGYAIGRLGCFLNGCCFGLPARPPLGIVFPEGALAYQYCGHQAVYPTQLYASVAMLIAFLALVFLYKRKSFSGEIFFAGLVFYSLYRFLIEFLRFSPLHFLGLTPSQLLVIPLFFLGVWGLIKYREPIS